MSQYKNIIRENYSWWVPAPSLQSVAITFKNFSIGYNASPLNYFLASGIFFFFFIYGLLMIKDKEKIVLMLSWLFIPIAIILLASKFKPIYVDRYLIPGSFPYYLITAYGLSRFRKSGAVLVSITLLSSLALWNYYSEVLPNPFSHHAGVHIKMDTREVANYITANYRQGDAILHTTRDTTFPFEYYLNREYNKSRNVGVSLIPEELNRKIVLDFSKENNAVAFFEPRIFGVLLKPIKFDSDEKKRIWLVATSWLGKDIIQYNLEKISWMNKHYKRIGLKRFNGILLFLYENRRV